MDIKEQSHNDLMAALRGIAAGKGHTQSVNAYGASVKIFDALNNAMKYLPEPFHADDMDAVDKAFKQLGLVRTSDRKDEAARTLLTHFIPPSPAKP
jgi:hypothetical protein